MNHYYDVVVDYDTGVVIVVYGIGKKTASVKIGARIATIPDLKYILSAKSHNIKPEVIFCHTLKETRRGHSENSN